jgi:hypothetical protein
MKKYKRIFTFGCSFTLHTWPTWASIINKELDPEEFYNYGNPGAGNQYIYTQVVNANKKHIFNEDDLVLIMWSTYTREDRYKYTSHDMPGWVLRGNMFNSGLEIFSTKFMRNYISYRGLVIRDLTVMTLLDSVLTNSKCDYKMMLSTPVDFFTEGEEDYIDIEPLEPVTNLYSNVLSKMAPIALIESMPNKQWGKGVTCTVNGRIFEDSHPDPVQYLKYLEQIGYTFSESTVQYAIDSTTWLHGEIRDRDEIGRHFCDIGRTYAIQ